MAVMRKFWGENGSYEKVWWKMAVTGKLENGSYQRVWGKMAVSIENTKAVSLETTPRPTSDWCVVKVFQTCLLV